jgi:hypothetical protein
MLKGGPINARREHGGALVRTVSFEFAERQWIVRFSPTSAYLIAQRRWQAWCVLAGGLLFIGLLSSFLLVVTGNTNKLQAINEDLQREIAERKTSQNELAKYPVIVDSLDEVQLQELRKHASRKRLQLPHRQVKFSRRTLENYSLNLAIEGGIRTMSFTKSLSFISLAAVIFIVSGSSIGFVQQSTSPIAAAKDKILSVSQSRTTGTTNTSTSTVSNTTVMPRAGAI